MKQFLLLASFLCMFFEGTDAQVALQNRINPGEYKPYEIKIKSSAIKNESAYYFRIIDARPDTTRLGMMKDGDQQIYFHLKEPASVYLFPKINSNNRYKDSIIVVLNKMWVYESFTPRKVKLFDISDRDYKIYLFGRVAAEVYKKTASGTEHILSYDSTIRTTGYMANNVDYLVSKGLNIFLHVADSVAAVKPIMGKNDPITQTIPPVLQVTHYKDGIYLSFDDFLKNEPAEIAFTYSVKKKEEKIILTDKRADDSLYTAYNWGFCKNGEAYVRVGPSFSKLTRVENSFELRAVDIARFYKYKGISAGDIGILGLDLALINTPSFLLMDLATIFLPKDKKLAAYENTYPFKLDLKTGEFY